MSKSASLIVGARIKLIIMSDKCDYAKILFQDTEVKLPIIQPTYGLPVVDVRPVGEKLGLFTFDPGFKSI